MAASATIKVYKNEDVNNPEYATVEEVQRAFFGRGVFIKNSDSVYEKVIAFYPIGSRFQTISGQYQLAKP